MNSIDYLIKEFSAVLGKIKTNPMQDLLLVDAMAKAKEMHKQEIIDAYYQCGRDNFEHIKVINRSATEYYQETFVSKKKIKFTEEEWAEINNGSNGSDECYFEPKTNTSAATICKHCGKEKFLHKI